MHPNEVYFLSHGIVDIKFTETCTGTDTKFTKTCDKPCHCITTGQPYEGVIGKGVNARKGEGYVTVGAGRKNSDDVAGWFGERVASGFAFGLVDTNAFPNRLNFALQGTLTLTYSDGVTIDCENILIAQGSVGGTNNWWLGASKMKGGGTLTVHGGKLTCKNNGKGVLEKSIMVFSSKSATDPNHFNAN